MSDHQTVEVKQKKPSELMRWGTRFNFIVSLAVFALVVFLGIAGELFDFGDAPLGNRLVLIAIGGAIICVVCFVAPLISDTREGYDAAIKRGGAIVLVLLFTAGTSTAIAPIASGSALVLGFGLLGGVTFSGTWMIMRGALEDRKAARQTT